VCGRCRGLRPGDRTPGVARRVPVAAALVPAAAAVGIGVAWGLPTVAVGAFVLLAVNLVSINLAAATVFWALGYRSGDWDLGSGFTAIRSNPGSAVLVLLVVVGIVASGGAIGRHMTFENGADTAVQTVLEEPRYDSLEVVAVRTTFGIPGLPGRSRRVTVQVRRSVDQSYPDLADELARAVRATTGLRAAVTVEYTERQRSGGEPWTHWYAEQTRSMPSSKLIRGSQPVASRIFEASASVSWTNISSGIGFSTYSGSTAVPSSSFIISTTRSAV
jgi:hypothetical protein